MGRKDGKDKLKKDKKDVEKDSDRKGKRKAKEDYDTEEERKKRRKHHSKKSSKKEREKDRDRRKRKKKEAERSKRKNPKKKRYSSSSSDDSSSGSDSDSSSSSNESNGKQQAKKRVVNKRLLAKLAARGETLQEREQRRSERRAARITAQFGYTAQENPFNDPNIAETFTWKKKVESVKSLPKESTDKDTRKGQQDKIFDEIEKVRKRRRDYEEEKEERERIRADESRMKELEKYDEWAQKEEIFHLQQQRHRSAIRLVEGREKPIDVLAKNLLIFGLTEEEKQNRAAVKYKEKYNALEEVETLEAELEDPHEFISCLKVNELEEMLIDIEAFRTLEKDVGEVEAGDANYDVVNYWDNLHLVTKAEIQHIKSHDSSVTKKDNVSTDIQKMFDGQTKSALVKMQDEVEAKIKKSLLAKGNPCFDEKGGGTIDLQYWQTVLDQLLIHLAKMELSDMHSKMLVCQLEKLEQKKHDLEKKQESGSSTSKEADNSTSKRTGNEEEGANTSRPKDIAPDFGNLEEELGLDNEIDLGSNAFNLQEKYRPRKPRYFNRVKTGYDWNKYNQTHYDHDNPPPKIVQGYKFNIFYPDLFDKTTSPKYTLEPTDSPEFCILRFSCGPPYEDIAFKIINRQWNKSRKRGFRCTFERGVLSLYFNFATHWYRR